VLPVARSVGAFGRRRADRDVQRFHAAQGTAGILSGVKSV
jgi:hypothetical protein